MRIEPVIGQRIAGVIGGVMADQFRTHEDLARQLESIAAMARAYHAQQMAQEPLTRPPDMEGQASVSG